MIVTPRIFALSIAASATLGGGVGALAAAATTSQASPQAIAAAVQRVRDSAAERDLQTIGVELLPLNELLSELKASIDGVHHEEETACRADARNEIAAIGC